MFNYLLQTARKKGLWAALCILFAVSIWALMQDRIVSAVNEYLGTWSEFVAFIALLLISGITVYGMRALLVDYGVPQAVAYYTARLRVKASYWLKKSSGALRKQRAAMARRWLRLSEEIMAEMPDSAVGPRLHNLPNLTQEQKKALWNNEVNQMIAESAGGMERARRLFLARLTLARDEMVAEGINLGPTLERSGGIVIVNTFCLRDWAAKLGAEGRRILIALGEEP